MKSSSPVALSDSEPLEIEPASDTSLDSTAPSGDIPTELQRSGEHVVLTPQEGWRALDLKELWRYRELIWVMGARDLQVRYKQATLGIMWAIVQPLMTMVVFSIFFGRLAKIDSQGVPYAVFSIVALLPWNLFSGALGNCGNSLVTNENLLKKVYFPRLILPIAPLITGMLDFAIGCVVATGVMIYFRITPSANIWALPFFILLALVTAFAVGIWLAALNVRYRDVRHIIPFLTQVWLYASPVIYSANILSPKMQVIYGLNPMAGVIQGFRWSVLGVGSAPGPMLALSTTITIVLLIGGLFYFRRTEEQFSDII